MILNGGNCFMKTKIIYISGNEVFDMNDIRAAFEEVRTALNLDKTTVLFGVPVDEDDAGLTDNKTVENIAPVVEETKTIETITETPVETVIDEIIPEEDYASDEPVAETIEETIEETNEEIKPVEKQKKRGRPRKEAVMTEPVEEIVEDTLETVEDTEKVIPILSVLGGKETAEETSQEIEVIPEISDTKDEETIEIQADEISSDDSIDEDEADLEKLLSAMTPLAEDITESKDSVENIEESIDGNEDVSVDATLEQLATEFVENQDKISAENKPSSRSKIGKLRNILPFKQSKHKDQNFGDLFNWGGIAANDEDFSVPGFFTAAKK